MHDLHGPVGAADADDGRLRLRRILVLQPVGLRRHASRCRSRYPCNQHVRIQREHTISGNGSALAGHGAAGLHPGKRRRIVPSADDPSVHRPERDYGDRQFRPQGR